MAIVNLLKNLFWWAFAGRSFPNRSLEMSDKLVTKKYLIDLRKKLVDQLNLVDRALESYDTVKYKKGDAVMHRSYGICVVQEVYPRYIKHFSDFGPMSYAETKDNEKDTCYTVAYSDGVRTVKESELLPYNDSTKGLYGN